jgi:membrane-bound lytic murein transglycosylase D
MRDPNSLYFGQRLKISSSTNNATASKSKIKNFKLSVKHQGKTITKQQNKKEIKIKRALPERTLKVATKTNKVLNENRPAFMPVSFSSKHQESIGTITVDFDETLSHYAEWSLLSVRELRKINRIGKKAEITVHGKLRVSFSKTNPEKFEERRQEYHKAIQEDFFNNYDISKLTIRSIEKGETLWEICNDNFTIPLWLLSSYNSEKNINALEVGEPIIIPVISPKLG